MPNSNSDKEPDIKAVCFDLFHTLVDVGRVPGAIGKHTADLLGIDRESWQQVIFSDLHEIRKPTEHLEVIETLARSVKPDISDDLIKYAAAERQKRFDHTLLNVGRDTLLCLQQVRAAGLGVALVSNASTAEVASWKDSPLAPLFDATVFSWECGYAKPEAGIYHHASQQLNVDPEECLFVGDGGSQEHRGASAAGMHTVMITRFIKSMSEDQLQQRRVHARYEIDAIEELMDVLAEVGSI